MNTLLDNHNSDPDTLPHRMSARSSMHDEPYAAADEPSRELTLGTTTILTLFFALAILCAGFFAFGYSLGTRHIPPAASTTAATPAPILDHIPGAAKPSPGSPATSPTKPTAQAAPSETVTVPSAPPTVVVRPAPTRVAADSIPADLPSTLAPAASPSSIVQVAAVSHQEDAELIASTLKRRGYAVAIRTEPQDKLFHLQLGPFPSKKDAEAMRQRLLADGFNAYIK